jgi:hypothetical protein
MAQVQRLQPHAAVAQGHGFYKSHGLLTQRDLRLLRQNRANLRPRPPPRPTMAMAAMLPAP